jgi:hypothetical protein
VDVAFSRLAPPIVRRQHRIQTASITAAETLTSCRPYERATAPCEAAGTGNAGRKTHNRAANARITQRAECTRKRSTLGRLVALEGHPRAGQTSPDQLPESERGHATATVAFCHYGSTSLLAIQHTSAEPMTIDVLDRLASVPSATSVLPFEGVIDVHQLLARMHLERRIGNIERIGPCMPTHEVQRVLRPVLAQERDRFSV